MNVVSLSPLRTASLLWQTAVGQWALTIVCKATYRLMPDLSPLNREQEDANENDCYWNDDPCRSLASSSDLVPFKAKAEVLLIGHAHAPDRRAVRSLVARMIVGDIDKAIEVFDERAWAPNGQLREGPGFSSMPLVYERAAGGLDTWNPVGIRLDAWPDVHGNVAIPNLQPPGATLVRLGDFVPPIGFGPLAPDWAIRRELLGSDGAPLSATAWREAPLPAGLDPAYFNVAPRDQQVDAIRSDERIVLENLHPEHPRLVTTLPGLRPRVFAEKAAKAPEEIEMRADTLVIDTDQGMCTLVWRGQLALAAPEQSGRVVVAMEEKGQRVAWGNIVGMEALRGTAHAGSDAATTARPKGRERVGRDTLRLGVEARKDAGTMPPPPDLEARKDVGTTTLAPNLEMMRKVAVPFQPPAEEVTREQPPRPHVSDAGLPFAAQAAPVMSTTHPSPPVWAPTMSELSPPPIGASPWGRGVFPTASGPTGGIERFSPNVPPPPMVREVRSGVVAPPVGMGAGLSGKELAQGGALAASNAAAGAAATSVEGALAKPAAKGEVRAPREVLELIWYDPAALPRIRRNPQWKKIIAELKPRLSDDDFDGGLPPEQMKAAKDRRDVFGVLARGEVINLAGIQRAMDMAVLEDGSFVPPYVLTAGTLELLFDEMDTLKATMVAVAPFVPIDKKLKEVLDYVNEVIRTPGIERARGVMEGLCAKVRVTFGETARGVSKGYLDEQIEPMLLEGRCYQKQIVTGKSWIKATLTVQGATGAIPVSLAEASTSELPMSRRFQARLLVEARNKAAGGEPHGISLRTIATGHRLP